MTLRTSPIGLPPSSSSFSQTTPALHPSRLFDLHDASSSSPPDPIVATPTDADKYGALARGRTAKTAQRRSVRTRTSSTGRTSSPQVMPEPPSSSSATMSSFVPSMMPPTRPRPSRTASNTSSSANSVSTGPPTRARAPRPTTVPPRVSANSTANTLALAQAHGISADQFEEARQQVMRFLRTESGSSLMPQSPSTEDKGKGKQTANRSSSSSQHAAYGSNGLGHDAGGSGAAAYTNAQLAPLHAIPGVGSPAEGHVDTPYAFSPGQPSRSRSRQASARSAKAVSQRDAFEPDQDDSRDVVDAKGRIIRPRVSYETIQRPSASDRRRDEDLRKESQMRQWAQEESSSSEEEEPARIQASLFGHRGGPVASTSSASLLPSPSFGAESARPSPSPVSLQSTVPKSGGMMERFMSDRKKPARPAYDEDEEDELDDAFEQPHPPPVASTSSHSVITETRHVPASPKSSPERPTRLASTASPPPMRSSEYSPDKMMTSPAPSRGGPGLLFSPDVARLLRSELDELEANESSAKKSSSLRHAEGADLQVDDVSSPYRSEESPFSSNVAKRTRDVLGSATDSTKRARWANERQLDDIGATSPTPSSASLRAPSFCDSSPAMSDKASTIDMPRANYTQHMTHPASAPDFLFNGLPSSSPASSQTSHSDYAPPGGARHRSSPGPSTSNNKAPTLLRTTSAASGLPDPGVGRKRGPMKRADTSPALAGPDGHAKPHWSYAALIGQAIFSTEQRKISLADVYQYIMVCYPYYRKEDSGWQNSIRHNLSLNECFVKTARGPDNPGKGCLWAISPGCEEQFADGNFVKKGGSGNGRKPKGARSVQQTTSAAFLPPPMSAPTSSSAPTPSSRYDLANVRKAGSSSATKRGRDESPAASSTRGASPAPSNSSMPGHPSSAQQQAPPRSYSPATSAHETSPSLPQSQTRYPAPPTTRISRPTSAASDKRPSSAIGDRREVLPTIVQQQQEQPVAEEHVDKKPKLAAPYVPRVAPPPREAPPAPEPVSPETTRPTLPPMDAGRRHSLVSPIAASPPTSVYHRLAGPYQPISYSQSSINHRALALLASPEASGIMHTHSSSYDRNVHGEVPSHPAPSGSSASSTSALTASAFLPAPHIFSGSESTARRTRSASEDKEDHQPAQSMLSPTNLMHTQSPISSIRGGPRAPMSPLQASEDKFSSSSSTSSLSSYSVDPEKKHRANGMRHLPAVAALADASSAADMFRSPPQTRHLRSPSSRSLTSGGPFQAALMSTPGARAGARAWGMSPGVMTGDGGWGFGDSLEAELERMEGAAGENLLAVTGSGSSSNLLPRHFWPSPGPAHANTAW